MLALIIRSSFKMEESCDGHASHSVFLVSFSLQNDINGSLPHPSSAFCDPRAHLPDVAGG